MVYEKFDHYLNRKRWDYKINGTFWKIKQRLCSLS